MRRLTRWLLARLHLSLARWPEDLTPDVDALTDRLLQALEECRLLGNEVRERDAVIALRERELRLLVEVNERDRARVDAETRTHAVGIAAAMGAAGRLPDKPR